MLFVTAFLNSGSYCLPDGVNHTALIVGIAFEHIVDLGLRYNKLDSAEEIFSHGRVSMVEALNGLDVCCDKLV